MAEGGQGGAVVELAVDKIAGEEDEIGRVLQRFFDQLVVGRGPVGFEVEIGEVEDSQTLQWCWKIAEREVELVPGERTGQAPLGPGAGARLELEQGRRCRGAAEKGGGGGVAED